LCEIKVDNKVYPFIHIKLRILRGHHKRKTRASHSSHHRDLLADAYTQLKAGKPVIANHARHDKPFESVREFEYNGHQITIRTSYDIRVDGKKLGGHIYVDNFGRVSTHALPAYSFGSTVDLIKKLIDMFGDNFLKVSTKTKMRKKR
jgi:hypothetical protein